MPYIDSQDRFKGEISHSSMPDGKTAKDKNVVFIGAGAKKTAILARSDKQIMPRNALVDMSCLSTSSAKENILLDPRDLTPALPLARPREPHNHDIQGPLHRHPNGKLRRRQPRPGGQSGLARHRADHSRWRSVQPAPARHAEGRNGSGR